MNASSSSSSSQNKINIPEHRKKFIETLVGRCFKDSTGQDYEEGKPNIKKVENREKFYDLFLITFTNYNQLKMYPRKWLLENESDLTKSELEYLATVCVMGNHQLMAYFSKETGLSPPMFYLYLTLLTYTDTEPPTNISKNLFPNMKLPDGSVIPHKMKEIADDIIRLYEETKPEIEKELKKNFKEDELKVDGYDIYPNPYVFFVYPEIYSKMAKEIEDNFWKNNNTEQLEKCVLLRYLQEMTELYRKAYQFQQKFGNALMDYINKNKLSKDEIETILKTG
jgi:hypothetical protein